MRNKQKFTLIAVGFALVAILIGSLFGKIDSLQASRKLTANDYHVGAVSVESGKVVESKQNFYSDMFELEEAEIKVKEDCTASYRVFFYNEDKAFIEATEVSGVVLTKLAGTAKGGIVLAIRDTHNIPIKFVCLGEKVTDIEYFDLEKYIYGLFAEMIDEE